MKSLQPLRRASIPMQRQWNNMSIPNKIINKITKSDVDRDGVPNKWDCRPRNPFRQESYCINCGTEVSEDSDLCPGCEALENKRVFKKMYRHDAVYRPTEK
jgi:hypothetical protein